MKKVEAKNVKRNDNKAQILGVAVTSTSADLVLNNIREKLEKHEKFFVVTPNPEQLLIAGRDREFRDILNKADISIPDGMGLIQAAKFQSLDLPRFLPLRFLVGLFKGLGVGLTTFCYPGYLTDSLKVVKGRELFLSLVELADSRGWRVVLLGDKKGSAEKAARVLRRKYKKVEITAFEGPEVGNIDGKAVSKDDIFIEEEVIRKIARIEPQILFVGFGAPRQEKWVCRNFGSLKMGGAMVLGGAFDYISGVAKIPPEFFSRYGLEWMWRLFREPRRIWRILHAFPLFPLRVFWCKLNEGSCLYKLN